MDYKLIFEVAAAIELLILTALFVIGIHEKKSTRLTTKCGKHSKKERSQPQKITLANLLSKKLFRDLSLVFQIVFVDMAMLYYLLDWPRMGLNCMVVASVVMITIFVIDGIRRPYFYNDAPLQKIMQILGADAKYTIASDLDCIYSVLTDIQGILRSYHNQ